MDLFKKELKIWHACQYVVAHIYGKNGSNFFKLEKNYWKNEKPYIEATFRQIFCCGNNTILKFMPFQNFREIGFKKREKKIDLPLISFDN